MKPSEYISQYGSYRDIHSLENCLIAYIDANGNDIDQLRALNPDQKDTEVMGMIEEFEREVVHAKDTLEQWRLELRAEEASRTINRE